MKAFIEAGNDYVSRAWTQALTPLSVEITDNDVKGTEYLIRYQDYDNYDFETRDRGTKWVYSYVYRKALTRKNYLGRTIAQFRAKRPHSSLHSAWPESYDLELDFPEFLDDALDESWDLRQELEADPSKVWILKPALGERADGIKLFRGIDGLQAVFDAGEGQDQQSESDEEEAVQMRQFVVQEYIMDPLLLGGRKFHLRVYCLCVGRLTVYVSEEMLALFSTADYDSENLTDLSSHLTNTCFGGPSAKVSLLSAELDVGSAASVRGKIFNIIHDLFAAAVSDSANFQARPSEFEFFGLDFLVTSVLEVKLLEVNAYPDFKQTGADLRTVVDKMFSEAAGLLVAGREPRGMHKAFALDKDVPDNLR